MVTSHGLPDLPHHYGYRYPSHTHPVYQPMYQHYMPNQAMPLRYKQVHAQQDLTYLPPYHADKKKDAIHKEYAHADIHHADIHHADIHHADINHADIHHAYLHHTKLHHANLHIADILHDSQYDHDHQAKTQEGQSYINQLMIFVSALQFWLLCC